MSLMRVEVIICFVIVRPEGQPRPEADSERNFAENMRWSAAERLRPASPDMTSLTLLREILL